MDDEANQRVLITGGSSGIGLAAALAFRARAAEVAILDRTEHGPDGFIFEWADVAADESVQGAVSRSVARLGGLDVLVNCAGIGAQGGVEANSDEEWHSVFDVNVLGMVRVTRSALPALLESKNAAIVNVGSVAATVGLPDRVLSSATKGAVLSMSLAMAADLLPFGVARQRGEPRHHFHPVDRSLAPKRGRSRYGTRRTRGPPAARPARDCRRGGRGHRVLGRANIGIDDRNVPGS